MEGYNSDLLIDSNFVIALYNPVDNLHRKAKQISERLKSMRYKMYISEYIFLEIVTVLSQRGGREIAIQAGKDLLREKDFVFIQINEELHKITWQIFQEIKKKDISFVDCSILAAMRFFNIKKLLTFDKEDFTQLRRKYRFSFL